MKPELYHEGQNPMVTRGDKGPFKKCKTGMGCGERKRVGRKFSSRDADRHQSLMISTSSDSEDSGSSIDHYRSRARSFRDV